MANNRRGKRGNGQGTQDKKRARASTHVMQSTALTWDDVLVSLSIALVCVGLSEIEILSVMYFIKNNSAEVASILDEKHSPVGTRLNNIPLPIYRSLRAGYMRVNDDVPDSTATGATESAAESVAEIADESTEREAKEAQAQREREVKETEVPLTQSQSGRAPATDRPAGRSARRRRACPRAEESRSHDDAPPVDAPAAGSVAEVADDAPAAVAAEPISQMAAAAAEPISVATDFNGNFKEWLHNSRQRAEGPDKAIRSFKGLVIKPLEAQRV